MAETHSFLPANHATQPYLPRTGPEASSTALAPPPRSVALAQPLTLSGLPLPHPQALPPLTGDRQAPPTGMTTSS